jgi:hypothetical protein
MAPYCVVIDGECSATVDALICQAYTCPEGKGKKKDKSDE